MRELRRVFAEEVKLREKQICKFLKFFSPEF